MEANGTDGRQLYVAITAKNIERPPSSCDRHPDLWSREVSRTFSRSQIPDVHGTPHSARQPSGRGSGNLHGVDPGFFSARFFFPLEIPKNRFFSAREMFDCP